MQGQCYGYIRRKVYSIKYDQRELMKVVQRNFRKFMSLRNWGWFIIIQKTKPLIGQINLEEELRMLEEKAENTWGEYKKQVDTKAKLEEENVSAKEEIKALMKQLESEQGNLSQYTEKQAKMSAQKAEMEIQRQNETANKKALESANQSIKKDIEDLEL